MVSGKVFLPYIQYIPCVIIVKDGHSRRFFGVNDHPSVYPTCEGRFKENPFQQYKNMV